MIVNEIFCNLLFKNKMELKKNAIQAWGIQILVTAVVTVGENDKLNGDLEKKL